MKNKLKIVGYVRGLSQYYQDGTERMEMWISKDTEQKKVVKTKAIIENSLGSDV